ncbi:hypothetical protein DPSP01_000294 [Paraphaeosphaeria sporulosa]|uniref:Uncharacterized protein n=1 Tax=Paraphaeosphaeria sporulosa TaxID=1460663 RepID=A0A177D038_9PLEO|nr:uncharacterized protein CC84DRAFT_1160026 [Paraphaeosphaeria sporulosa]OAG12771.1 hypothetical protein CC84DRAFT_1160026 [Paraphaeosphaeria sporulosa]
MVLQDIGTPEDSFSDNPYPSDNDAYTSTAPAGQRYDASILPQPLPFIGPLLGFSSGTVRFKTESTLKYAEMKLHRPLTAEEAQTLAGHLYQLEQTKSYFTAAGAGAGVYRWYKTWELCRYPLYKPKPEDINPNKFLFVKGPMAQYARHSWRLFCYVFVAGELGKLVGQILAQPVAAQASANDPKLVQFAADLKNSISSDTARMNNRTARSSADERRAAWEAAAKSRAGGDANTESRSSVQKPTYGDDDMSPTAGNEPWPSSPDNSWGDSSFSSESAPTTQSRQQPYSQQPRRPSHRDEDDTSPTGGMFQDEVQSQSKSGESAWDRLRRGGVPTPQGPPPSMSRRQPPHQEQREGSTLGDSFTFVDSDDDRRRERERAKKEFDARIDQERQGKDFNENRRW